jgi:hypothetical protein
MAHVALPPNFDPNYEWPAGGRIDQLMREGRLDRIQLTGYRVHAWWRIACERCGVEFTTTQSSRRYCDECREPAAREHNRERQARHRAKR